MTIEDREFDTQHYVYVEGNAPMMDGEAIANAMGMAFGSAFKGIETHAMTAQSAPICVYADMPGAEMTFRAGFLVSPEDAAKASGDLKAGELPAGKALHKMHIGPYATMNQSHQAMWDEVKSRGMTPSMPVWEIYIDDPSETAPDSLRTEIYHHLAG